MKNLQVRHHLLLRLGAIASAVNVMGQILMTNDKKYCLYIDNNIFQRSI